MKTIVITGASAGVGRATARAFAAQGARMGLIARNEEALEAAKSERAKSAVAPSRAIALGVAALGVLALALLVKRTRS